MTDTQADLVGQLRALEDHSPIAALRALAKKAADELERLLASNEQMAIALNDLISEFDAYGGVDANSIGAARAALKDGDKT